MHGIPDWARAAVQQSPEAEEIEKVPAAALASHALWRSVYIALAHVGGCSGFALTKNTHDNPGTDDHPMGVGGHVVCKAQFELKNKHFDYKL